MHRPLLQPACFADPAIGAPELSAHLPPCKGRWLASCGNVPFTLCQQLLGSLSGPFLRLTTYLQPAQNNQSPGHLLEMASGRPLHPHCRPPFFLASITAWPLKRSPSWPSSLPTPYDFGGQGPSLIHCPFRCMSAVSGYVHGALSACEPLVNGFWTTGSRTEPWAATFCAFCCAVAKLPFLHFMSVKEDVHAQSPVGCSQHSFSLCHSPVPRQPRGLPLIGWRHHQPPTPWAVTAQGMGKQHQ